MIRELQSEQGWWKPVRELMMNTHLEESVGNGSITERIFRRYERGIIGDVPMITGVVPCVSASGAIQRFFCIRRL